MEGRYRLTVRTEPSQGLNTGSIPVSATIQTCFSSIASVRKCCVRNWLDVTGRHKSLGEVLTEEGFTKGEATLYLRTVYLLPIGVKAVVSEFKIALGGTD